MRKQTSRRSATTKPKHLSGSSSTPPSTSTAILFPGKNPSSSWLNLLPLFILAALGLALIYAFFYQGGTVLIGPKEERPSPDVCVPGMSKSCMAGNCSGKMECINGIWSGCRWERICTPDSRVPCLSDGCAYSVKACNECGTGYGPCLGS